MATKDTSNWSGRFHHYTEALKMVTYLLQAVWRSISVIFVCDSRDHKFYHFPIDQSLKGISTTLRGT